MPVRPQVWVFFASELLMLRFLDMRGASFRLKGARGPRPHARAFYWAAQNAVVSRLWQKKAITAPPRAAVVRHIWTLSPAAPLRDHVRHVRPSRRGLATPINLRGFCLCSNRLVKPIGDLICHGRRPFRYMALRSATKIHRQKTPLMSLRVKIIYFQIAKSNLKRFNAFCRCCGGEVRENLLHSSRLR